MIFGGSTVAQQHHVQIITDETSRHLVKGRKDQNEEMGFLCLVMSLDFGSPSKRGKLTDIFFSYCRFYKQFEQCFLNARTRKQLVDVGMELLKIEESINTPLLHLNRKMFIHLLFFLQLHLVEQFSRGNLRLFKSITYISHLF